MPATMFGVSRYRSNGNISNDWYCIAAWYAMTTAEATIGMNL